MKSFKQTAGSIIEIFKPRNIFIFSALAIGSLAVKNFSQAESAASLRDPQSTGVHREGNVINASAQSPYKVNDMVFLFQGAPGFIEEKKKPNLQGGLGADGNIVHITKAGDYQVQEAGFKEFFATLWNNKMTAAEIMAGSLIAWALMAPYAKGAKKTVADQLTKEIERLKTYILEDETFGKALTKSLEQKAMSMLDAEVHGGSMFPESKDMVNAKNYEQWKIWRQSGVPEGTSAAEVNYYNTLAPRLEKALADKVGVLKQGVLDQMAANIIESLPNSYSATKKAMLDAQNFKLNEAVPNALQSALEEKGVGISLSEVQKGVTANGEVAETKVFGEFLTGLTTRCDNIKKSMSTFIREKMPLWSAVKADFTGAESSLLKKAGKPLLFIGALMILGYGISNLDKMYLEYSNRVKAAEALKAYKDAENANTKQAQTQTQTQVATNWIEDNVATVDLSRPSKYRLLLLAPKAGYSIKNVYLDVQPSQDGGPEVGFFNGMAQFGVKGTMKTNMAVVPGKYYLMELELDPINKKWVGTFSEVDANQSKGAISKLGAKTYLKLGDGDPVKTVANASRKNEGAWNVLPTDNLRVIVGRDEAP